MVLLVVIGITSTNKTFPAAYSFAKSESAASFSFLLDCFKYFIFGDDIAEARVVLANKASGLIAAMPAAMPQAKLQHCNWHVSKNIAKRLAEKRYLAGERKESMNYVWRYIQSSTEGRISRKQNYHNRKDEDFRARIRRQTLATERRRLCICQDLYQAAPRVVSGKCGSSARAPNIPRTAL